MVEHVRSALDSFFSRCDEEALRVDMLADVAGHIPVIPLVAVADVGRDSGLGEAVEATDVVLRVGRGVNVDRGAFVGCREDLRSLLFSDFQTHAESQHQVVTSEPVEPVERYFFVFDEVVFVGFEEAGRLIVLEVHQSDPGRGCPFAPRRPAAQDHCEYGDGREDPFLVFCHYSKCKLLRFLRIAGVRIHTGRAVS